MLARILLPLLATLALTTADVFPSISTSSFSISERANRGHAVPYSAADPQYNKTVHHFNCGTSTHTHASEHFLATVGKLHAEDSISTSSSGSGSTRAKLAIRNASRITVPLYMHVVTTSAKAGTVPQSMVNAQVATLNKVYNAYGVVFSLAGTDFTANDAWAQGASDADDAAMKTSLRRGSYAALNLYLQTDLVGGILGKCSLPTSVGSAPVPAALYSGDGCNIAAGTMPGGAIAGYNLGMTAVHETGHWLGLLHTFEGYSCSGSGDYISDTAVESQSTSGCPTSPWKNSCPRPVGFFASRRGDPIRNYMDYSTDACYAGFTDGQVNRWKALFALYRAGN